jgi:4-amino-4-deoxy-L-arabinose transferase-like glycosyltransferase
LFRKRIGIISGVVVFLFLGGLILNLQRITHAPHLDDLGSGSLLDSIFAIELATVILFLAAGLGSLLIKPFKLNDWTFIERTVFGLPLGLAAIAYGVFFLGLAGWIKPIHLICWLVIITVISFKHSCIYSEEAIFTFRGFKTTWLDFSIIKKVFFSVGVLALLLALFQAFTPPWDYDGLAYHLQGPRLFLEAGRIIPIPENWFTYYPSTWEMLYMLGMGLGSDIFARLIHFSTMILFLLATYAFGRRFLPNPGGWIAAAIMMGIPILPLWGNAAYTDIAWALFQFLAIALFLVWIKGRNPWLLGLSGVMQGLALGSKYLALSGAGILLLFVIWFSLKDEQKWAGWKITISKAMIFGMGALIVALPWYLKNFIWTGNPIFPLYFPQYVIDPIQLKIWMGYVNSFGTGKDWYDYLLLPINIYLQHDKFGSFMGSMEMPNPLFLLVFTYSFFRRKMNPDHMYFLDILSFITAGQFAFWMFGSQQTRFLLPLYPSLCILAGSILLALIELVANKRIIKALVIGLVSGMISATLIFMSLYLIIVRPDKGLFGSESKSAFLQRMVRDYSGIQFSNDQLPDGSKMMLLWDGRGYYCDRICLPDVDQSRWVALVEKSPNIREIFRELKEEKITHLFLSNDDSSYFLLKHDSSGLQRETFHLLINEFLPKCSHTIYIDDWSTIYQLSNEKSECY